MIDPTPPQIHTSAIVEDGVEIGVGTSVWDSVHIRGGARIGSDCIVDEKSYIAGDVVIGDLCKLNAMVYICAGVTIGHGVMVAAHTVFTNELLPHAADPDLTHLWPSEATEATLRTEVEDGATIGANSTIGPGVTIGAHSMVGMGSVVTKNVAPHAIVLGNPAKLVGIVCRCGEVLARGDDEDLPAAVHECVCERTVHWTGCAS